VILDGLVIFRSWGAGLRLIRVLVILVPTPISRRDDLFPAMTIDHLHQSTHGTETPATLPSGSQIGRRRHDARTLRAVTDRALFAPSLCECSLCECSLRALFARERRCWLTVSVGDASPGALACRERARGSAMGWERQWRDAPTADHA